MKAKHSKAEPFEVDREKLLALVGQFTGVTAGLDNPEGVPKRGPWDPVVKKAVAETFRMGPFPQPWTAAISKYSDLLHLLASINPKVWEVIGGGPAFQEVALNPQPLPPRFAFLTNVAEMVIERVELMQEIGESLNGRGQKEGIIVVGGRYLADFIDEWCGTGYPHKWPFPGPRPHWFPEEITGLDKVIIASRFELAGRLTANTRLGDVFNNAAATLAEAGFAELR